MDDLSFLDTRKDWQCAMCGINLDEACRQNFPTLYDHNALSAVGYYERKRNAYVWERTQESPHLTCCRSCGFNYKAWKLNLDSKSTYIKGSLECDKCGKPKRGGRVIIGRKGKRVVKLNYCRACHRLLSREGMRLAWEEQHREWRREYHRKHHALNRDKDNAYKRAWRKKQKANIIGVNEPITSSTQPEK
jgi:hypothetical protein